MTWSILARDGDGRFGVAIASRFLDASIAALLELEFLQARRCDEIQGCFFARPMPAADCTQALVEQRRLVLKNS